MRKILLLLSLSLLFSCSTDKEIFKEDLYADCRPSGWDVSKYVDPKTGLAFGDIIPSEVNEKGAVLKNKDLLWNDTIPFIIQGDVPYDNGELQGTLKGFDSINKANIREAVHEFGRLMGKVFIEYSDKDKWYLKNDYKDGIIFHRSFGNSSHLGRQGGLQKINLAPIFWFELTDFKIKQQKRATYHELGHTIFAMIHEQNRADRDDYVEVHWENIYDIYWYQFQIVPEAATCGEFDIYSVMFYDSMQFSTNGEFTTTRLDGSEIPINFELSEGDINTAKVLNEDPL